MPGSSVICPPCARLDKIVPKSAVCGGNLCDSSMPERYTARMGWNDSTDCHFTKTEAARYLSKSVRWFDYQLSSPNPPPGFKLGKCWLFRKSELDRWLEQFRAGADLNRIVDEVVREWGTD